MYIYIYRVVQRPERQLADSSAQGLVLDADATVTLGELARDDASGETTDDGGHGDDGDGSAMAANFSSPPA